MSKHGRGQLRIIAGQWRGRKLAFPDRVSLRPTPDRVRETLFNWLQAELPGSRCLDLFAGSGALGFEAASRGAGRVLMVDNDADAVAMLEANRRTLDARQTGVIRGNVFDVLEGSPESFDIVFLDPPYSAGLLAPCYRLLENGHWLSKHAKIYIECDARESPGDVPGNWHCLKSRRAGQVGYYLYSRTADDG